MDNAQHAHSTFTFASIGYYVLLIQKKEPVDTSYALTANCLWKASELSEYYKFGIFSEQISGIFHTFSDGRLLIKNITSSQTHIGIFSPTPHPKATVEFLQTLFPKILCPIILDYVRSHCFFEPKKMLEEAEKNPHHRLFLARGKLIH